MDVRPFRIRVAQSAITELHRRLDLTRWPDQLADTGWEYGTELGYQKSIVDYWRSTFDWRAYEAKINAFAQFHARIDGLLTHFIHARSAHPHATPLLMVHGWPGSVIEFLKVIPRLTQPERFGGSVADACHVVCPSLPGYGWSEAARDRGMGPKRIAERHLALMDGLGYRDFVAQGGDWGSIVSRFMPELAKDRLLGLHLNLFVPQPPMGYSPEAADALCTPDERSALASRTAEEFDRFGYAAIQGTRPQTLGYGLCDSPVGLCGWITEKFRAWSDHQGELRDAIGWDDLLGNVSLYWFTNSITSSIRLYREYYDSLGRGETPRVPMSQPLGVANYPGEIMAPPRAWVEAEHNLVHWFRAPRGGHFAALEQPEIFANDLRDFVSKVRRA